MRKILRGEFFNRPTLKVARELLGKFLVRKQGRKMVALMITDVEAYIGHRDRASHASRGKTARNALMFGQAGYWYIYFTYGMHWMLNIVTEGNGYPAAILIRGVQNISGPARITKFLKIDKKLNGLPASRASGLWIEDRLNHSVKRNGRPTAPYRRGGLGGIKIKPRDIVRGKRIGVDYAGKWKSKLWRFYLG